MLRLALLLVALASAADTQDKFEKIDTLIPEQLVSRPIAERLTQCR
jgi:hypothetical protein